MQLKQLAYFLPRYDNMNIYFMTVVKVVLQAIALILRQFGGYHWCIQLYNYQRNTKECQANATNDIYDNMIVDSINVSLTFF